MSQIRLLEESQASVLGLWWNSVVPILFVAVKQNNRFVIVVKQDNWFLSITSFILPLSVAVFFTRVTATFDQYNNEDGDHNYCRAQDDKHYVDFYQATTVYLVTVKVLGNCDLGLPISLADAIPAKEFVACCDHASFCKPPDASTNDPDEAICKVENY